MTMDARNSLSAQCVSAEKKPGEISQEKIKYNQDRERTMDDFVVSSQKENSSEIFPFVCGLCDSKFSRIVPYYKHLRQHEEIYKESFFDCNKECKENNSAKYQPYHCAICNIGFVTICQLHFHIIEEENIDIYVYEQRSRMVRPVNLDFGHQSASGKVSEQIMSASKLEPTSKNSGESNTYKSDRANDHEQKIILNVPETCSERIVSDSKRKSSKPPKYGNVDKKCKKHLPTQMPQHTCQRKCLKKSGSDKITKAAVDLQIKQEDEYGICEESSKPDNCSIGNDVSQQESVVVETEPDVDLRIFKRIEKYQMELKKRREKYRKKVKERAMQQKMEKSFAEAGTSICNEKDKNAELSDTQTSIRNEEEIHALVNNVHSNGSHSKANDDGMTRCKTQPEEMDTEIVAKDAEPQIKKTPTNSQADHTGQKVFANDMLIPCHICGRMYKKRHMGNHLVSHQETRSFQCDVCNKYYKTKTQLQLHKEHHEAERNFVCRFCGKAFNTKGNLRQHERTHTAQKIYQCPYCPDKFTSRSILKYHVVIHSDAKPYVCDICNQAFKRRDRLHQHQVVHTDKRPFLCSTCKKAFKTKRDCSKHEAIHRPATHFCGYCNKGFVSKSNMRIHERIHKREIK